MNEQGTVTKIDGASVTVRIDMEGGCAGCMNREACGLAGSEVGALDSDGRVRSVGERVEIEIPARAQAAGAFWLLVLPLIILAGGYVAGTRFFRSSGEGPAALLGIAGFAVGLGVAWMFLRSRRESSMPRVVRVVDPGEGPKESCLARASFDQKAEETPWTP